MSGSAIERLTETQSNSAAERPSVLPRNVDSDRQTHARTHRLSDFIYNIDVENSVSLDELTVDKF